MNYATSMKNQDIPNYCDASWAFATTSSVADRMRLLFPYLYPIRDLATQVLINCDYSSSGCQGGHPLNALMYMQSYGLPDETCLPYSGNEEQCIDLNVCRTCVDDDICYPVYNFKSYYVSEFGKVSGEEEMRSEILQNGPITCRIHINNAFRSYHGGIFTTREESRSIHYISIIGWGKADGIPYWIARNSWGSYWGEQGYIRILRGVNLQGIEEECYWGIPSLNNSVSASTMQSTLEEKEKNERGDNNNSNNSNNSNNRCISSSATITTSSHNQTIAVSTTDSNPSLHNFVSCGFPTDWTLNKAVIKSPLPWTYVNISSLPMRWDIRNHKGQNLATPNSNQHSPQFCNSCWAQATASALSDRLQIQHEGRWPLFEASAQVLVNCANGNCEGGDAGDAYRYAYYHGLPDKTCQAYEGRKKACEGEGICMDCDSDGYCWEVRKYRLLRLYEYGEVSGVENMMAEIYTRGPITCFMVMTDEFMEYKSGVFVEHDHHYKGGHIVEVTGWGVTSNGQKYWIVRNNWGENWGENGWFRISMGGSNLLIESACSWGVPYLFE